MISSGYKPQKRSSNLHFILVKGERVRHCVWVPKFFSFSSFSIFRLNAMELHYAGTLPSTSVPVPLGFEMKTRLKWKVPGSLFTRSLIDQKRSVQREQVELFWNPNACLILKLLPRLQIKFHSPGDALNRSTLISSLRFVAGVVDDVRIALCQQIHAALLPVVFTRCPALETRARSRDIHKYLQHTKGKKKIVCLKM